GKAKCYSFPLGTFEKVILSCLREIDPKEVLGREEGPDETAVLEGEQAGVEAELAEAAAFMEEHGFSATIGKRIATLEARKTELMKGLEAARAKAAVPAADAWKEFGTLADALDAAPDPRDARLRLRAALRRMVKEMRMLVVPRGRDRLAACQIS